ncbi:Crp/Fnr family transcriptional regulator [Solemya velesiana gill symbiont]|uniref:Cyclic nucleotide-binding domain-containing protein n=1 Tax=Solemya velesiana gill symbiont TaxID=1918948 RepID=A0A1T2KVI1_9GAMM|nr:Crp/Fnr family transcriptional regulator [Solemya velesiana gill symbiont]OOZ36878.1 hypothetical protein BOW51_04900 [Solemya velesiana gill symbiont]
MDSARLNAISSFFSPLVKGRNPSKDPLLAGISKKIDHLRFERNAIIFNKGDTLDGIFLIAAGQVKLAIPSCSGHDRVLDIIGPGSSFGEANVFINKPSPICAQSITSSEVLFAPKQEVLEIAQAYPDFTLHLLGRMSGCVMGLIDNLEVCCTRPVRQRVACYLIENAEQSRHDPQALEVNLPTSKQIIASMLHLTP